MHVAGMSQYDLLDWYSCYHARKSALWSATWPGRNAHEHTRIFFSSQAYLYKTKHKACEGRQQLWKTVGW
jgi:hypothetical protein